LSDKNKGLQLEDKTVMKEVSAAMSQTRASIALLDTIALFKSKVSNAHTIAGAIGFDPVISEQLLREVNSPHYSLPHRVKELHHAISLLGFKRTQEVVQSLSKNKMYEEVENSYFELMGFKKHGIAVGCFAQQIAQHLKLSDPVAFFKAGTMHDIGKYFYLTRASAQFEELVKIARTENLPLYEVERTHLKTDHAEIGYAMATEWDLSPEVCAAVRYHHGLDEKARKRLTSREIQMVEVVSYANLLSHGQKNAQSSTGRRVQIKDLPPPPGIITEEDLARIIIASESQYDVECENAGITSVL
jgi:putative nucleotidyltransferase with HDIG domain